MAHRLSPEAEAELDNVWYYVATASGSMDVADRFIESLTRTFFLLALHPYMGRRRDEDLRPGMRSFVLGKYIILYRLERRGRADFACGQRQQGHRSALWAVGVTLNALRHA